jgi:SAM-dependent methyltransferase
MDMNPHADETPIISLAPWFNTAVGAYAKAWERARLDELTADIFGFNAVQVGLPQLDALAANRMPNRWVTDASAMVLAGAEREVVLLHDFTELPFATQSLDLLVLPHVLEFASEPHQVLREVERVLVPEGRVVICGMEPLSLWGASKALGRGVPEFGDLISQRRIRDWLKLLSFEVDHHTSGCFRPMLRSDRWLQRMRWMDTVGSRWWPLSGAVYFVQAVKRVKGMRLISPVWKKTKQRAAAAATTASKGME